MSSTSTPTRTHTRIATSGTETSRAPAPLPSFDEVLDALSTLGYEPKPAARLLRSFNGLTKEFKHLQNGHRPIIAKFARLKRQYDLTDAPYLVFAFIDPKTDFHALLELVMLDGERAIPGAPHDVINRHFLGEDFEFLHDYHNRCVLAIVPKRV